MSFLILVLLACLAGLLVSVKGSTDTQITSVKRHCPLHVVEVGLNTRLFITLGRGLTAITEEGEKLLALLQNNTVVAIKRGNCFLAIVSSGDFEVTNQKVRVGDKTLRMARVRHESLLQVLSNNKKLDITKLHKSALKRALKELSRTGVVRGVGGKGVTDSRLNFNTIALNPAVLMKLGLSQGQHVFITRFPQGSATAAMVEAIVTTAWSQHGIIMNPELSLLLGGDHDGDEYYVYIPRVAEYTVVSVLKPMTADLLLQGADAPGLAEVMPTQKHKGANRTQLRRMGWDDRTKVLGRGAIGIFTTLAYQAALLMPESNINDKFLPAQELIFDLFKFNDILKIDVTKELQGVIQQPLENRFSVLHQVALHIYNVLSAENADHQYVQAFKALVEGAQMVHTAAQLRVARLRAGDDTLRPELLDARAVPNWASIDQMLYGKGVQCNWILSGRDTLTSERSGYSTDEEEVVDISATLFNNTVVSEINDTTHYLLGTKTSTLAVYFEDSKLMVVRRWQYTRDGQTIRRTRVFPAVEDINIEFDYLGISSLSGQLLTAVETGKRIVNAHIVNGDVNTVLNPLEYYAYCLYQAVNNQWATDTWVTTNNTLSDTCEPDLKDAIRKAHVEWIRRAEVMAKTKVGVSFQSKAILFDDDVNQDVAMTLTNELIGKDNMFVATKTADKGYIIPCPGTKEYRLAMKLWYDADEFSQLISHNRVGREQLPSHAVGMGRINVVVADLEGYTYSTTASSWDALKKFNGQPYETGKSTADCSAIFKPLTYTLYKTIQVEGIAAVEEAKAKYEALGWTVELEDKSFKLYTPKGAVMQLVDGEENVTSFVAFTLRLSMKVQMKEGHAYKWMVGPGAKSMARVMLQSVTAMVDGKSIEIAGMVSALSLKGKNAEQAVTEGSARLLGVKGLKTIEEHLELHQINGADELGRYPVMVDGKCVGSFVVLSVPYWVLPYTTEGRGTRTNDQPWVAPTCFDFASKMEPVIPAHAKLAYLKALLPVAINEAMLQQGEALYHGENPESLDLVVNQVLNKTLGFTPLSSIVDGEDSIILPETPMNYQDDFYMSDDEFFALAQQFNE